ncbi:MAG: DrmE family protein [Oscillospiraceae bacterium]|nr:DrmE family protein [Oscillospiraceae bacterium]
MPENVLGNLLEKCDIFYGDALISKEDILRRYVSFFAGSLSVQDRSVSFALHTGSVCFDIISVVTVSLGAFAYNLNTNDDILAALNVGDIVMFQNERYRWKGTKNIEGKVHIVLEQDGRGMNGNRIHYEPYEKNKHAIRPYYGTSSKTDGRGVRRRKTNRADFFSYVYGIPISDVPVEIDTSVVVVADRAEFSDIYRKLLIVYGDGKRIGLSDLVPASYYTSGGSVSQFGINPTKTEAVLKVTGKIGTARDLVLDRTGKKVVGLLVSGLTSPIENATELADLLRRKSLRFAHITSPMRAELCENILNLYTDSSIFACTKEFLSQSVTRKTSHNTLTDELYRQVANVLHNEVIAVNIGGGMGWDKYKQIKRNLMLLKQSNWANDKKEDYILSAYTLLNILTTAPFPMDCLEEAIRSKQLHSAVVSPYARIQSLREISGTAGSMKEICSQIVDDLELQYGNLKTSSPKCDFMHRRIEMRKGANIAIVLPKAYYADVIMDMPWFINLPEPKPKLTTVNRFNIADEYDYILVIGDIGSKRFNVLQCYSAKTVDVLLYDCEGKTFRHRQYKAEKLSRQLNRHISVQKGEVYEEDVQNKDVESPEEIDIIMSETTDLDQYIENIGSFDIKKLVSSAMDGSARDVVSEVRYVGVFTTGERILFSKFYGPIVFDSNAGTVAETSVEKLSPGDLLVFVKRNDYTHNIVDYIYDQLISLRRLNEQIIDATEKAFYWKEVLREYKEKNGYTYQTLARKLKEYGSSLTTMAVRQWLTEDSHIVGPRKEKTFEQIANMTQDPYLMKDPRSYFEGCNIVRHERREILSLIAKAINDKLSGHVPPAGSIFEVVYDNVENLSEIMEIDSILYLDEVMNVPINLVNRPISESEG